jgi:hypothetical protein
MTRIRFRVNRIDFSLRHSVRGPPILLPEIKLLKRDISILSSAEASNVWSFTSTTHIYHHTVVLGTVPEEFCSIYL